MAEMLPRGPRMTGEPFVLPKPRTFLPPGTWIPVFIPNPDRRWWQVWKPRRVFNPAAKGALEATNRLLEDLSWMEAR